MFVRCIANGGAGVSMLEECVNEGEYPVCHVQLCARCMCVESHSLALECKLGGKLHAHVDRCFGRIVHKYHVGNMKKDFEKRIK